MARIRHSLPLELARKAVHQFGHLEPHTLRAELDVNADDIGRASFCSGPFGDANEASAHCCSNGRSHVLDRGEEDVEPSFGEWEAEDVEGQHVGSERVLPIMLRESECLSAVSLDFDLVQLAANHTKGVGIRKRDVDAGEISAVGVLLYFEDDGGEELLLEFVGEKLAQPRSYAASYLVSQGAIAHVAFILDAAVANREARNRASVED